MSRTAQDTKLLLIATVLRCRHDANELLVGTMQNSMLRFPVEVPEQEATETDAATAWL